MNFSCSTERFAYVLAGGTALGAWVTAWRFPSYAGAPSGPQTFPLFLSAALAGLSLLALVRSVKDPTEHSVPQEGLDFRRLLVLGGFTATYLLVLPYLGFVSSTALYSAAVLMALGLRNLARALAAGFIFAYVLVVVFERLMNVPLPKGWIG